MINKEALKRKRIGREYTNARMQAVTPVPHEVKMGRSRETPGVTIPSQLESSSLAKKGKKYQSNFIETSSTGLMAFFIR